MSNLSAIEYIANNSAATTGLWNQRLSTISANFAALNSDLTVNFASGETLSVFSNIDASGRVHAGRQMGIGATPSAVTTAVLTIAANSSTSDYIHFEDLSGGKSNYLIGSRVGGTADGLNLWDLSGDTMIASFSKQSVRFYQNVVGPVFDVGGALASTFNAATFGTGADSTESRIQAAISQASTDGIARVYVPASMYPYSAASVSFDTRVQMVREGGNWAVYDIQAYGADPLGVTDAFHAIRGALSAVPQPSGAITQWINTGAIVEVPPGTYSVASTLTLPSGIILRGTGSGGAELRYTLSTGTLLYYRNPAAAGGFIPSISIRNLRLTVKSGVIQTAGAGIHIDNAGVTPWNNGGTRLDLEDVQTWYFYDNYNLFVIQGGDVRHCDSRYARRHGWYCHGLTNGVAFTGGVASGCSETGWRISGAGYSSWNGQTVFGIPGTGLYVESEAGDLASVANSFGGFGVESSGTLAYFGGNQRGTHGSLLLSASAPAGSTGDGLVLNGTIGLTLTAQITANGAGPTGYAIRGIDPTAIDLTTLFGDVQGTWGSTYTGIENITFINFQAGVRRTSLGGSNSAIGFTSGRVFRSGVAGTATQAIADDRFISSDNAGASRRRMSCDVGNSYADLWHNSLVNGPFTIGSFGDAILAATDGNVTLASWNTASLTVKPGSFQLWRDPANNLLVSVSSQGLVSYTASGTSAAHVFGNSLGLANGVSNSPSLYFSSATSVGWYRSGASSMALTGAGQLLVPSGSALTPSIALTSALSTGFYNNFGPGIDVSVDGAVAFRFFSGAVAILDGSAIAPSLRLSSERSLGWFRSGSSTMAVSYGTFNLAAGAVNLSMATMAAATSAVDKGLALVFRASGLSLIYKSGTSIYDIGSGLSGTA